MMEARFSETKPHYPCCGPDTARFVVNLETQMCDYLWICLECGHLWNEWGTTNKTRSSLSYHPTYDFREWLRIGVIVGDMEGYDLRIP